MVIKDRKDIPTCLDCIHCNEYVSEQSTGKTYYCENEMFDLAPRIRRRLI